MLTTKPSAYPCRIAHALFCDLLTSYVDTIAIGDSMQIPTNEPTTTLPENVEPLGKSSLVDLSDAIKDVRRIEHASENAERWSSVGASIGVATAIIAALAGALAQWPWSQLRFDAWKGVTLTRNDSYRAVVARVSVVG